MDSQKHNAKTMDQHNVLTQVNQVHTVRKAGFGWQTVAALTIIVILIIIVAKCRKIRAIRTINCIQKILVSPQSFQNCPHFGKLREIRRPFFDLNNEKWDPKISQQIARKSHNLPPPTMNHAKSTRFSLNPINPCSPTVPQPFHSKSREIRSIR